LWIPVALSVVLHAYIAWRVLPALGLSQAAWQWAFGGLLVSGVLTPAPLLLRLSRVPERAAAALAWTGYMAMGAFSTAFVLCVLRDLLLGALAVWEHLQPRTLNLSKLEFTSAWTLVGGTFLVSAVGLFNARRTARVVDVDVPIVDLPAALGGFTIVQLSDIHVGPTIKRGYLEAIVRRVNGLDADVIAITGDLIDGSVEQLRDHTVPLGELRARHGTYCVTGNHEYYHGVDAWVAEWRRLGLRVLLNENVLLSHGGEDLLIGGVTDYGAHHHDEAHRSDANAAVRCSTSVAVKILLAHQPRSLAAASAAGFDVQLSGHTHGGQFLPWNAFVPLQQPTVAGLARLHDVWLYVSRGTGYWGPPLRFFAPSEITRLRLTPAS
jgi:predicted MPP superfamily phosphohydrolase